ETVMSGRSTGVSAVPVMPGAEAITMIDRSGRESRSSRVASSPGGEIAHLENRVGLVDDLEALLGRAVAAMRIRMVELDQRLVARLELGEGEGHRQVEHGD